MKKTKNKAKNKDKNVKLDETFNQYADALAIKTNSTSSNKTLPKRSISRDKLIQNWREVYKSTNKGRFIDSLISYILTENINIEVLLAGGQNDTIETSISTFLKSINYKSYYKYILKELLVTGTAHIIISFIDDVYKVNLIPAEYTTPIYQESTTNLIGWNVTFTDEKYNTIKFNIIESKDLINADYSSVTSNNVTYNFEENQVIMTLKINDFTNESKGDSLFTRMNEIINGSEDYLKNAKKISDKFASPYHDITVPASSKKTKDGIDANVAAASTVYNDWNVGDNVVHTDKEKWELKQFSGDYISDEVRRGFLLYELSSVGLFEMMTGDGKTTNLATAKSQIAILKAEIAIYRDYLKEVSTFLIRNFLLVGNNINEDEEITLNILYDQIFKELLTNESILPYVVDLYEKGYISYPSMLNAFGFDSNTELKQIKDYSGIKIGVNNENK